MLYDYQNRWAYRRDSLVDFMGGCCVRHLYVRCTREKGLAGSIRQVATSRPIKNCVITFWYVGIGKHLSLEMGAVNLPGVETS